MVSKAHSRLAPKGKPPTSRTALYVFTGFVFVFLYAPVVILVAYSFNEARFSVEWTGFTLQWYKTLFASPIWLKAIRVSVTLAAVSGLLSAVLGTALGYGLARYQFPGKPIAEALVFLPIIFPEIIHGVALLIFFTTVRIPLGMGTLVTSHVSFGMCFVALTVRARMSSIDPALEEAARDLGGNWWYSFRRITLPLLLPGVLAGVLIAITLSLDNFLISFFVSGVGAIPVPIYIYTRIKSGLTPEVNAISAIIVFTSFILVLFAWLRGRNILPVSGG